jgi:two-component system sensor histidine kinase PilS (NtrC family)
MKQAGNLTVKTPRDTLWRTLSTFTATRIFIAALLLLYLSFNGSKPFCDTEQLVYWEACIGYLLLAFAFSAIALFYRRRFLLQLSGQIVADIAVISLLYIVSGGGRSGLAILYLFPLAGGAILAPLVLAFFFSAAVTLVLLAESAYAILQLGSDVLMSQAGLYGGAFFVAVFAINRLAARLIKQEELAAERGNELQLQEAINRLVIADMGDGILVVRRDGTILTSNPAADRMLGLASLRGGRRMRLSGHATLVPIADAFQAWIARAGETIGDRLDPGSVFVQVKPFDAGAAGIGSGGAAQSAWASRRELTAHVKLRFAHVDGENELQDRTIIFLQDVSQIDNQAQQLKLASMGRLTASIAHEVRNPLSAISYSAALLLEESTDPGHTRLLKIVSENVDRLNRMIEDILRLSRKAHRPEDPLLLAPTMATIVAEFIETHGVAAGVIDVGPAGPYRVWFDDMHLQEVLVNLLCNALRYASGAPGSIRIDIVPAAAARLELHVQDDGAAISPEVRAHLFEPFYTTSSKGTGLGLYLARELCLNNGAVLDYEYRADVAGIAAAAAVTAVTAGTTAAAGGADGFDADGRTGAVSGEPSGRFVITFATADAA